MSALRAFVHRHAVVAFRVPEIQRDIQPGEHRLPEIKFGPFDVWVGDEQNVAGRVVFMVGWRDARFGVTILDQFIPL